ncbi:MAG: ABC transporter substrate-binding protein [Campylobacterales bacterium]|nr:ABC transporter substrate-binding protein [Campylobacterales bacterium]
MHLRFLHLFFLLFCAVVLADSNIPQKISVQLNWKHQFQFAGFYIAKERGLYAQAGFDVTLLEFQPKDDIVQKVLDGKVTYGVGYPGIIYDKLQQKKIVLLAALLQRSPHVLVSMKSSDIRSVKDFKNKKIMISKHGAETIAFLTMLKSQGVSMSDMQRIEASFNIDDLINGKVDLFGAYQSNEPYELELKGQKYDIWDPKDYGFTFYEDLLFTSQKELNEHPERVEEFLLATLEGFEYAYAHPEETAELILKKYNTQHRTKEALLFEAKKLKELAYMSGVAFGDIDASKIQRIVDIYNILGYGKEKLKIEELVYKRKQYLALTREEKRYLYKKKTITMCVDPSWMPFEKIQDGKHIGMSADYFALLQKMLPVPFKLLPSKNWEESIVLAKERKCDIMSLVMSTPEREKYLNFTDSYLQIPLVLATKTDAPFVAEISSLEGKRVGIAKGYAFLELLRNEYPNLDIIEVESLQDGLGKVTKGEIYGYIGTLATIGYAFQKNFTGELKIAGKFDGSWNLGIGVRNDSPILFNILQKAVRAVDEKQKTKIINDWLAIKYDKSVDYRSVGMVIGISMIIVMLISMFYLRERKHKKVLQVNKTLLESIVDNIPDPMFFKSKTGILENVNTAFAQTILHMSKEQIIGKKLEDFSEFLPKEFIELEIEHDKLIFKGDEAQEYDIELKLIDGNTKEFRVSKNMLSFNSSDSLGYIAIMHDITVQKLKERKLEELAYLDPLTKLHNRRYFFTMAKQLFSIAKRNNESMSVLSLDIDNFKRINDTYGHDVGDKVLVAVADLFKGCSRTSDLVARFGGEEFVALMPKTDVYGIEIVAEKIRIAIENFYITENNELIHFTVSIGVSEIKITEEEDLNLALKRADIALYRAKSKGKNRVEVF